MSDDSGLKLETSGSFSFHYPKQKLLYERLSKIDALLGKNYIGALIVLRDEKNPIRFVHAAHSIREIMEKLPEYIDTAIERKGTTTKNLVQTLLDSYKKIKANYSKKNNSSIFLKKIVELLANFERLFQEISPKRKTRFKKFLGDYDKNLNSLPPLIEDLRVKEWEILSDFFQGVSHNRITVELEKFNSYLTGFENYLMDRLDPRTFDDLTKIEKLIQKGETNDNP